MQLDIQDGKARPVECNKEQVTCDHIDISLALQSLCPFSCWVQPHAVGYFPTSILIPLHILSKEQMLTQQPHGLHLCLDHLGHECWWLPLVLREVDGNTTQLHPSLHCHFPCFQEEKGEGLAYSCIQSWWEGGHSRNWKLRSWSWKSGSSQGFTTEVLEKLELRGPKYLSKH